MSGASFDDSLDVEELSYELSLRPLDKRSGASPMGCKNSNFCSAGSVSFKYANSIVGSFG